jgi:starch synthase (maltosyl-transferring)
LIAYAQVSADRADVVRVCVVSLDPHHTQSGFIEIDHRTASGLEPRKAYQMHDHLVSRRISWNGHAALRQSRSARTPVHVMQLRARMPRGETVLIIFCKARP